jgi:hypothetical protein
VQAGQVYEMEVGGWSGLKGGVWRLVRFKRWRLEAGQV